MVNNVILIGQITGEVKEITTKTGTPMAVFTLLTWNPSRKESKSEFHSCVCFGEPAKNLLTYAKDKTRIYLEGRLEYVETKKEEKKTQINVQMFRFVSEKE